MDTEASPAVDPTTEPMSSPPATPSSSSAPNPPTTLDATDLLPWPPYVLLVDSNHINLLVMSRILERRLHLPYYPTTTGLSALHAFKTGASHQPPSQSPPSPLLLDDFKSRSFNATPPTRPFTHVIINPNLPHMDGLEAVRQMRRFEDESDMHPSLIIGSGVVVLERNRREAMESGMDWYVFRPLTFPQFRRCFGEGLDWL
ncbi:hypothetical protein K491DRAFT_714078 [Lophiostoma macrostomum CBS 122681]|uniref:Response regulatory domain-containing protein n=1 Tax=Lophiostoma macrostomum CBS 122681 TaxID=1314788 RepID=A0A6A6TF53_9PLEO|nr:hypothetical protein K491DRAFT_714078 [Lophiostoma macrostomum CBS 122681]